MAVPISISEFLDRNHVRYSLVSHPAAYTAQEEAAAAHVSGHEWAKAVVCIADDRPILAVLVGTRIRESVGVITCDAAKCDLNLWRLAFAIK
jgi:prolyl-tRNA editing enzyme YbaK/EbsC (Cys-tRNA(Pro) deacylase)